MHMNYLPGASYSTRICVEAGIETWTHLALPDSMSSCGKAETNAADWSQTASNARSMRRDGGRVVGDILCERGRLRNEEKDTECRTLSAIVCLRGVSKIKSGYSSPHATQGGLCSGFSSSVTLNDDIMDKRSLERGFLLLDDDCFWMTMDFEGLIHATWLGHNKKLSLNEIKYNRPLRTFPIT